MRSWRLLVRDENDFRRVLMLVSIQIGRIQISKATFKLHILHLRPNRDTQCEVNPLECNEITLTCNVVQVFVEGKS